MKEAEMFAMDAELRMTAAQRSVEKLRESHAALLAAAKELDSLIDENWELQRGKTNSDWGAGINRLRQAISDAGGA